MNQDSLHSFLERNVADWQNKSFLLAVSGGVDSMVLLDLFVKSKLKFFVAHCNFQLRGNDSDSDEQLVTEHCAKNNIPIHVKHFSTKSITTGKPTSIQMLARDLRYTWFNALQNQLDYDYLVVAHHATDQIETVLLNLIRGTGISGLRGMKEVNGNTIRPLLHFSKEDILFYAKKHNVVWREDISNQKNDYKRNIIRNKVLPLLKELNPSLEETFKQTAEKISDSEAVFQAEISAIEAQIQQGGKSIITGELLQSGKVNPTLLFEAVKKHGFVFEQVKNLFQPHISGTTLETENHQLIKTAKGWELIAKEALIFEPVKITVSDVGKTIPLFSASVSVKKHAKEAIKLKKDNAVLSLDADKFQFPLTIRQWQHGDKFVPFGMKGMKKISDLLIDARVPLHEKAKVFVLADAEGNILGVINYRGDERYKITASTTSVLELTYTPG